MKREKSNLDGSDLKRETRTDAAAILKKKRNALFKELVSVSSPDFLKRHAQLLNEYFRMSFEASTIGPAIRISANPYAIIALGGYGRQEQCVHSDVDLLFLFENRIPQKAEGLIR